MFKACTTAAAAAVAVLATSGCQTMPESGVARGEVLFQNCAPCHGEDGKGSTLVNAPQIAGLPAWYVEGQLTHFQTGIRGAHPDDVEGLKMRPMSRTIKSEADNKVVAEYVASLPHGRGEPSVKGDSAKGQAAFAVCVACHGADGAGNETLKAPPIRQLDDWYVVAQLDKFKSGRRGYDAADVPGAQMAGIAKGVADEQTMRDLAAYLHTLPEK